MLVNFKSNNSDKKYTLKRAKKYTYLYYYNKETPIMYWSNNTIDNILGGEIEKQVEHFKNNLK